MDDFLLIAFGAFFFGGLSAVAVFCFVMAAKQYRQQKRKKNDSNGPGVTFEPGQKTEEVYAKVMGQCCYVETVEIKTPKTVKVFQIVFETADGRILKLSVPEEMYDGFEQGQTGRLVIVDGVLYSFFIETAGVQG